MIENSRFLTTISNLHPAKNAINILKDIRNIPFFVYTLQKTGTSSLSLSLQKMVNNQDVYEHVVHNHTEDCWKRIFNIGFNFDLMSLIKIQRRKPIVFQLSRDPIDRLISFYFHIIRHVKKESTYADLIAFLEKNKHRVNYEYYQEKFEYKLTDLNYNHSDKCCVVEKENCILFFMKMEDFNSRLKQNLITHLSKYGINFQRFHLFVTNQTDNTYHKNTLVEIATRGIPTELSQSIFSNNLDEIRFFFSQKEIQELEKKYNVHVG